MFAILDGHASHKSMIFSSIQWSVERCCGKRVVQLARVKSKRTQGTPHSIPNRHPSVRVEPPNVCYSALSTAVLGTAVLESHFINFIRSLSWQMPATSLEPTSVASRAAMRDELIMTAMRVLFSKRKTTQFQRFCQGGQVKVSSHCSVPNS